MDFAEGLVAKDTSPALVPLIDDGRNEAGLWRFLDLRQALLAAGFSFRPARAFTQAEVRSPHGSLDGSLTGGNAHRSGMVCFRAGYDPFATELEVSSQSSDKLEQDGNYGQKRHRKKDVLHRAPFPACTPSTRLENGGDGGLGLDLGA